MHRIFIDSIFTDIVTFTLKCSIIFGVLVTRFNEFSLYTSNRINFVELILGYLERKTMWKFLKKHRQNLGGSILLKLIENVPEHWKSISRIFWYLSVCTRDFQSKLGDYI